MVVCKLQDWSCRHVYCCYCTPLMYSVQWLKPRRINRFNNVKLRPGYQGPGVLRPVVYIVTRVSMKTSECHWCVGVHLVPGHIGVLWWHKCLLVYCSHFVNYIDQNMWTWLPQLYNRTVTDMTSANICDWDKYYDDVDISDLISCKIFPSSRYILFQTWLWCNNQPQWQEYYYYYLSGLSVYWSLVRGVGFIKGNTNIGCPN